MELTLQVMQNNIIPTKPHLLNNISKTKLIQMSNRHMNTESTMKCHLLSKTNNSTDQSTPALL